MGRFKLGSTIVAFISKGQYRFCRSLKAGSVTRLGELFATVKVNKEKQIAKIDNQAQ